MLETGIGILSGIQGQAGRETGSRRIVTKATAGATGWGVTIRTMSDVRLPGRSSSWGSMLGAGAGKTLYLLKGKPGRNKRFLRGFQSGAAAFMGTVGATLRVLFLEVSGFIFISFTVIIVSAFLREYRKYATHQVGLDRVVLAGAIGAMFLYFGLSSFWRARRKRSRIS